MLIQVLFIVFSMRVMLYGVWDVCLVCVCIYVWYVLCVMVYVCYVYGVCDVCLVCICYAYDV